MSENTRKSKNPTKWVHPNQVMQLHREKLKQKALQVRIKSSSTSNQKDDTNKSFSKFNDVISAKRKNPFATTKVEQKRVKIESLVVQDESMDQAVFKLLHSATLSAALDNADHNVSLNNLLNKIKTQETEPVEIVKVKGVKTVPIDWSLKTKVRLISPRPFPFSSKLKLSEEASGLTSFTRCVERSNSTNLNESSNAKFHRFCLYWQQPSLPWLHLFPRTNAKATTSNIPTITSDIRKSLQLAWTDSLRSLFQLIKTQQCPYFYLCANNFTILFRAGGICGEFEINAMITPTTRGFRQSLKQEEIEFEMPLKKKLLSDPDHISDSVSHEENIEAADEDEEWMQNMGINSNDIKQFNYAQARIEQQAECKVDNSEESLIIVRGCEVHALYNFLINCKSIIAPTGPLAGIPPTLLAPVAFAGATLNSLKVRENKIHIDNSNYYSIELCGPILPEFIHNLCLVTPPEQDFTATFSHVHSTLPLSKVKLNANIDNDKSKPNKVFIETSLSDCGLNPLVLKQFCSSDFNSVSAVECLKYSLDSNTYTFT